MKRLLAILCTLALMLSIINPAVFAAENSSLQAAMDDNSSEIIVLEEDASNLTVDRDTTIDLNGHSIDGVTVTGGTLYCLDSQTADYTVADGIYGHVTNVAGNVKAAEGYLQVGDSFHAVNLDIYAMTLRASDVGVYYKSNFAADEVVAAQVESFGVALSVVTAPNADNLDTYCGYSVFTGFEAGEGANATGTSTLLKGIMKAANGDNKNAKNAAMPIYGRAYIKTAAGYVFGETVKRSLQEQVEAIDGVWASLTDSQKAPVLGMLESYTAVMEGWNIPNIQGIQVPGADEEIQIPVNVTAENGIVTEAVTVEQDGVSVTVPAGVKLAEGATALTLTVTPKETSDTGIQLEKNEVLMPMDVHVEGLAADNAQPLTIYLGKIMPENLNMGNYAVYHVENGNANEMTLIPVDAEFTAHNQYKYSLDGELTLYVANFSEFAARATTDNTWNGTRDYSWYNTADTTLYIRNADQLAGFGAIVGGMATKANDPMLEADIAEDSFAGKKVVLTADISIGDAVADNGKVFYPIGYYNDYGGYTRVSGVTVNSWFKPFRGTFDGNGNTISDFYQNTWEMFGDYNDGYAGTPNYYRDGMGLFGKVYGGTVRNLNVRNFSCDSEHGTSGVIASYADCGATFENIAIFDCNPRVYNIGNGGIVGCAGWYAMEAATEQVTFRNITVDNSNKISALWDASGTSAGGILGQYYPTSGQSSAGYPANPGVHFKDCRVSAILEVNNDCISNYHYYWYRYTGMLMGSVRANKRDTTTGHLMADTTGIEAVNCEVSFGYWNEFWYCELVKNTIASYTHDHQFSRLTSITDVTQIKDENGNWNQEGNFALLDENRNCTECFHIFKNAEGNLYRHFHDQGDETNGNEPYEVVNGVKMLKEDRQRYLLPFHQILTGDGMGILAHQEFEGVTIVEKDAEGIRSSQEKFVAKDSFKTGGGEVKLSDIFTAKAGTNISVGSVQAYISPVGEDSTVKPAACVISDGDWKNGTLKIEGLGKAKITITDYWYCTPTTIEIIVEKPFVAGYHKVTSIDEILAGGRFVIVAEMEGAHNALGTNVNTNVTTNKNKISAVKVTVVDGMVQVAEGQTIPVWTIAAFDDGISLHNGAEYLYYAGSTDLKTQENAYEWSVLETDTEDLFIINAQTEGRGLIYRASDYNLFGAYATSNVGSQSEVYSNKLTLFKWYDAPACEHVSWTAGEVVAPNCTDAGYTVYTCEACGATENRDFVTALGHTEETVEGKAATCTEAGLTDGKKCSVCGEITVAQNEIAETGHSYESVITTPATCTEAGLETYTCANCDDSYTEKIAALGHNFVDGTCSRCDTEDPNAGEAAWTLVNDASTLKAGDKIVIVAKDYDYALSTTQNNNNRGQASIVKSNNNSTISEPSADVQILTLENGNKAGTFAFYTGSGYLYAASSSSNHLKTKTDLDDNGSWEITIATDGTATVKAQGSNTRNWLRYNGSNNPPIFSAYGSGQADVVIYKQIGEVTEPDGSETTGHWVLVTDASALKEGNKVVIVSKKEKRVAGSITSEYMSSVAGVEFSGDGQIDTLPANALILTLGGSANAWTLSDKDDKMLGATAVKKVAWDSGTTTWSITVKENGDATIQNGTSSYGRILYNVNSPRFTTYTSNTSSSMLLPQLYVFVEGES